MCHVASIIQLEYCKDQREMTMELLTKAVQIDNHSHKVRGDNTTIE